MCANESIIVFLLLVLLLHHHHHHLVFSFVWFSLSWVLPVNLCVFTWLFSVFLLLAYFVYIFSVSDSFFLDLSDDDVCRCCVVGGDGVMLFFSLDILPWIMTVCVFSVHFNIQMLCCAILHEQAIHFFMVFVVRFVTLEYCTVHILQLYFFLNLMRRFSEWIKQTNERTKEWAWIISAKNCLKIYATSISIHWKYNKSQRKMTACT